MITTACSFQSRGPEVFGCHTPRCGFWLGQNWCSATGGDPDWRGHVRL